MIPLRHKNTIAGRVTAAVLRAEIDSDFIVAEGAAYKCALAGEDADRAMRFCDDATVDFYAMVRGVEGGAFAVERERQATAAEIASINRDIATVYVGWPPC